MTFSFQKNDLDSQSTLQFAGLFHACSLFDDGVLKIGILLFLGLPLLSIDSEHARACDDEPQTKRQAVGIDEPEPKQDRQDGLVDIFDTVLLLHGRRPKEHRLTTIARVFDVSARMPNKAGGDGEYQHDGVEAGIVEDGMGIVSLILPIGREEDHDENDDE